MLMRFVNNCINSRIHPSNNRISFYSTFQSVNLFNLTPSLGGTDSLIEHTATMTQGDWTGVTDEERAARQITPGFLRLRYYRTLP